MYQLSFQKKEQYDSLESGITIEVVLRRADVETICSAKVDTGSEICLSVR